MLKKPIKKIWSNLKRLFTWIHLRNSLYETFLSFVQNLKGFVEKNSKLWCFVAKMPNLRVLYETFFSFERNLKRFRREGFEAVSRWRTFLGFVEFFIVSFDVWTHLEAFWHLQNLFEKFGKKPIFLECSKDYINNY